MIIKLSRLQTITDLKIQQHVKEEEILLDQAADIAIFQIHLPQNRIASNRYYRYWLFFLFEFFEHPLSQSP